MVAYGSVACEKKLQGYAVLSLAFYTSIIREVEPIYKHYEEVFMRFSLQDVKKSIQRRGGDLSVSPHFLQSGELQDEIARLVAYHERLLGQPRRLFSLDEARACIGDYRLAHCLIATLSHWYSWRQREWLEAVPGWDGEDGLGVGRPPLADIAGPVALRLALYDHVNEQGGGFVGSARRAEVLHSFAESHGVDVAVLEYLLTLDSEEEGLLTRPFAEPPTTHEVAALYNQWVFEAVLFNASSVHFVIDCAAFTRAQAPAEALSTSPVGSGAGAVIKRLCFLARKLGVYYDLAYDASSGVRARESLYAGNDGSASLLLHLTLYGPQEVSGAPQQYGLRLARLCRLLLYYGAGDAQRRSRKGARTAFLQAIQSAQARVHFLQRAYAFTMDAHLLGLLPVVGDTIFDASGKAADVSSLFDSSIEQAFSEAFSALSGSQGVDGWRLEREPEPLLLSSSIFIPDFALSRGQRRIYVEILGFWTPSYRERKVQKLRELQERDDLLLAIPVEAREAFAEVSGHFPVVYYTGQLAVAELLRVLRGNYDDFAQRLAAIDVPAVHARVREEGVLVERLCYDVLHCYRRSELSTVAASVVDEEIGYSAGIGLYQRSWLKGVQEVFQRWLSAVRSAPLSEAVREIKQRWPQLAQCDASAIEALLALNAQVRIRRDSIFDAVVEIVADGESVSAESSLAADEQVQPVEATKAVKKQVRERRPASKKRGDAQETVQENLWG